MNKKSVFSAMLVGLLALSFVFVSCDTGNDDGGGESHHWYSFVYEHSEDAQNFIDFSEAGDGVLTIEVKQVLGQKWMMHIAKNIPRGESASYEYKFEAWTSSGSRTIDLRYARNKVTKEEFFVNNINITTDRKTYTYVRQTPATGTDVEDNVAFVCGDQTGTFYVKLISVTKVASNGDPKTIILTNVTPAQFSIAGPTDGIGIYKTGTTKAEILTGTVLADGGADNRNPDITTTTSTVTYPLYSATNIRWTGYGTYDVYVTFNNRSQFYKKTNVEINSATVTLDASIFTPVP